MTKQLNKMLQGAVIAAAAGLSIGASAQGVQVPAGLKWQSMREIVFNGNNFSSTGTAEDRALLAKIWAKELAGGEKDPTDGSLPVSFTLIGEVENGGNKVILTMYDRIGSECYPPGNGRGMVDMYATCPLRVLLWPTGKPVVVKNLPVNFCMLFGDDSDNPRVKNHNEYAFDERSGIVYLRLIQYGKVVPACNRALQVFQV